MGKANAAGEYLAGKLDERMAACPEKIVAHRGLGLMRGLALAESCPAGKIASLALQKGLLIITAGGNVLRFVPPLVVSEDDINEAIAILEECFSEVQ